MPISQLPSADQKDFRDRLAVLGLDENACLSETLEVPEASRLDLLQNGAGSIQPLILRSNDLDEVRRWVGVPDQLSGRREASVLSRIRRPDEARPERPRTRVASAAVAKRPVDSTLDIARLTGIGAPDLAEAVADSRKTDGSRRKLSSLHLETLRTAAYAYVRGDRAPVAAYKSVIEDYFGPFDIAVWLFMTITVKANSVLYFGPGSHNLTAWRLVIEPGGRVVSRGHLNVNCTIIERKKPRIFWTIPQHVIHYIPFDKANPEST